MKRVLLLAAVCALVSPASLDAQRGGRGRAAGPALSPRQAAPIDLAGHWVSPIIEDWKYRMVTPSKGVFDAVPLNAEGRKVGQGWDPARDEASGEQCRAYGAGGIMRLPGRLRISWQDDATLKVETDTGTQTRLLRFGTAPVPAEATWQGHSVAQWNTAARSLKVVTTNLRPGYVRKNGAPYSDRAVVTEYWDLNTMPNGDPWLTVIVKVEDPQYFTRTYHHELGLQEAPGRARLESHALLRTMNKGRLEAFSDGVLAIIITIMVLELRAPHGVEWSILRPLMPGAPQLRPELRVHRHLLEQPSPPAAGDQTDQRRRVVEQPAPAVLAVAGAVRDRVDGRERVRPESRGALRRGAADGGLRLLAAGARVAEASRARLGPRKGHWQRCQGQ